MKVKNRDGHRERKKILKSRYKATIRRGVRGAEPLKLKKIQYCSP